MRFLDFVAEQELDLSGHGIPDREVILIHRDVFCERRNRIVLQSGCVYGAPAFLSAVHYPESDSARGSLGPIIADMRLGKTHGNADIEDLHQALLDYAGNTPILTYHLVSQALTYNGETIIKGLPACILRRAILEHLTHEQSVFTYLEFKKEENPASYPLYDNFESNLSRLMNRLASGNSCIKIAREGRGKFRLISTGAYDYKEKM
jgi:hypothetical protein